MNFKLNICVIKVSGVYIVQSILIAFPIPIKKAYKTFLQQNNLFLLPISLFYPPYLSFFSSLLSFFFRLSFSLLLFSFSPLFSFSFFSLFFFPPLLKSFPNGLEIPRVGLGAGIKNFIQP